MKSVTEFLAHKLVKGIDSKKALLADGKSPEEIEQTLGETFKLEGDKLKHFAASLDVAAENSEKLARMLVVSLDEGENIPPKAVKVEEHYYVPEFEKGVPAAYKKPADGKGGGGKKGKKQSGPRPSPWGISPEEQAAKDAAKKASDRAKSKGNQ